MKNTETVPALNRILAVLVALVSASFLVAGLVAAFLAAVGRPFFYGELLIELFPYRGYLFDVFAGAMRILGGLVPVLVVMGASNIVLFYLTKGRSSARQQLASLVRGFAYQLRHPFSSPVSPMKPQKSGNIHEVEMDVLEIDPQLLKDYRAVYAAVYAYMGNYPLWKVQQEFRQLILALEPNTDNPSYEYHFHNIDNYLSKVIAVIADLKHIRPVGDPFWDGKQELSGAKGDDLLDEIKNKHPAFRGSSVT